MNRTRLLAVLCFGLLGTIVCARGAETKAVSGRIVTVVPQETDEILANPGMGWETCNRTSRQDSNLPSWIPSTVRYNCWGWDDLEPREGAIRYDFLDNVLRETRSSGQRLAFRVMCCSVYPQRRYHPGWLKAVGGRMIITRHAGGPQLEIPDLDHPIVLDRHLDFIRRLGDRYDGHADIVHVDIGSVGWWGEWHMSLAAGAKMPRLQTQKKIVDAYLAAFKRTPLLMQIGGGTMLRYAVEHGTGWRADCLGDLGGYSADWSHMRTIYPERLLDAGVMDAWKSAPVAWENCWDIRKWVEEGWSLRFIFNYALALHGSYIHNSSAPLPPGKNVFLEVQRFLRRLGYRLVLKELQHPATATPGDTIGLAMKWQNVGSAPCYKPYRVAYRLSNSQGYREVFVGGLTVNTWLPGSIEPFTKEFFKQPADLPPGKVCDLADQITLPEEMPAGEFVLAVGIVDEESLEPVVQLAIEGRDRDGWYPLSRVQVGR